MTEGRRPESSKSTGERRGTPRWVGQRRGRVIAGGVIGLAGLGAAMGLPSDRTAANDSIRNAARDVVREAAVEEHTIKWDLPNLDHDRVDFWQERFVLNEDMNKKMRGFLERSGRYVPMLLEKLDERGMPRDLVYLAMIESGFQPEAYSHAAASGLWQFIAETGKRYGLEIDRAVDERNDPVKATDAALDYLQELHERFGSWYLAAAAYNTGENRVGRIMREEFGRERATSEGDYYRIWSRLPRETRDYVPLMIAAARIAKEPAKHGFKDVQLEPPLEYDEVILPPATQLAAVAKAAGTTVDALRGLNPHFKLNRTPNNRDYPVRLPPGSLAPLAQAWGLTVGNEVTAPD